jgi:hypothetical protein
MRASRSRTATGPGSLDDFANDGRWLGAFFDLSPDSEPLEPFVPKDQTGAADAAWQARPSYRYAASVFGRRGRISLIERDRMIEDVILADEPPAARARPQRPDLLALLVH